MEVAQLILGNSNKRFSGVTSTMLQTLSGAKQRRPQAGAVGWLRLDLRRQRISIARPKAVVGPSLDEVCDEAELQEVS